MKYLCKDGDGSSVAWICSRGLRVGFLFCDRTRTPALSPITTSASDARIWNTRPFRSQVPVLVPFPLRPLNLHLISYNLSSPTGLSL